MSALPGREAFLFIAGANVAGGAYRIYSLSDPAAPTLVTAPPQLTPGKTAGCSPVLFGDAAERRMRSGPRPQA